MRDDFSQANRSQMTVSFMPPKTIVLVGLMGSGKTSIGKRLAKRLELSFFDSDIEVEQAAGYPIKEIYDIFGEQAFLDGEQRVIKRLLDQPTHVLATGGGSFANKPTREIVKEKAISVWLKADIDTLVARVSRRSDRPMFNDSNHHEVLEKLIEERYPVFEEADVHVETLDEPTNSTVDRVIQAMSDFIRAKYPNYYVLKSV
ncbi:MAG: shikimate kinase [Proteobacteria bacterium]|nr:shikimate kinase [Pseudomonadota bacterium]